MIIVYRNMFLNFFCVVVFFVKGDISVCNWVLYNDVKFLMYIVVVGKVVIVMFEGLLDDWCGMIFIYFVIKIDYLGNVEFGSNVEVFEISYLILD